MTNLDIIKYLSHNNPARLASFLNKICYDAWDFGRIHRTRPITDWNEWLQADSKTAWDFNSEELEKWSNAIKNPSIEITYPENLIIKLPFEGKDPNHMWNTDNNFHVISQAIDEVKLLENIVKSEEIPDRAYDGFRAEECVRCYEPNCMASDMEICDCHKFRSYYAFEKEN